ncbi:zinc finger protein 536-like isoform X5 [Homarus americanus]|uniref:zinc finger protein 536-like isoform X5 n=1 Tax=Homarus americanus TaxID=6706 RepID=UPI001C495462|nr:zinc finger protein 536-like isoform X5 [Homarus americanus]XP_042238372.1 zinc finger protein 536-like isoform X5 [Homarus americanus]
MCISPATGVGSPPSTPANQVPYRIQVLHHQQTPSKMDEGILSLRWNNHRSTFFHALSTLHRKELYSDVTLACNGKFFPVHKMVLSVCSEYFEDMFKQTTCKHPIIVLKDILHDDLEALLNYMYAGEANVAQSDLARLIKAAECLRIKGLAVPDEAPQLSDTKRPHTDSHRDETHHPKRRKHEDRSLSPSKSNQSHVRERRNSEDVESCKDTNDTDSVSEQQMCHSGRSGQNAGIHHHPPSSPNSNIEIDLGRSNREDNSSTQDLAEVVLEEKPMIKEEVPEPKHEHEDDITHLTDSEASINYDPLNSVDERGGSGGTSMYNPQMMSTHPQNVLQDLMVQGVPGTSAMAGDALAGWDPMAGFPLEGVISEDSRSSQAMGRDEGGSGASGGARRYCGPVGVSAVRNVEGSTGGLSCPYCGKVLPYHSEYQRHLRKHTGERPFACPHCAYATTRKSHLKTHMQKLHSNLITPLETWTMPLQQS